ncbi:serine/threonine-protein kinase [Polyangium aurulentum]|uniref:serine/threonine-protein kinase n=1 Tax=Polyangium aurulentum TaxID=2567896 RepID=UPI0010ADAA1E|nr:serine/threonine-protein kinase [Polyangium aurulentum]UQA56114.1 serine/threonine protein kinase [Polyangium aurulentum]
MDRPVRPGQVLLDKYRVERVLGKGGMGVVVAARHLGLGELFAIKFLLPHALCCEGLVERFLREARAAARLRGDHVARVHDVGHLDTGSPYMVMEHLEGQDLKRLLRARGGPLPVEEAVMYVLQACEAIAEAHSHGIVHRDIKPANLFLVDRPGSAPSIKVLDFGISKQVAPRTEPDLTRTGMVMGSPLYMSPEQMTRLKEVDPRSDIWSLGVVLYELVTGRVPFKGEGLPQTVGQVLQEDPLPPSALRPGLSPALDAIVLRCLEKRREKRFQSVGELVDALLSLLGMPAAGAGAAGGFRPSQPSGVGFEAFTMPTRPSNGGNTPTAWGGTGVETRNAWSWASAALGLAALCVGSANLALWGAPRVLPAPRPAAAQVAEMAKPFLTDWRDRVKPAQLVERSRPEAAAGAEPPEAIMCDEPVPASTALPALAPQGTP